jgi:hypothetical protein
MLLTRQNVDGLEIEFSDMLVEDQNNAALSYVDCNVISVKSSLSILTTCSDLCLVHKQITTAVSHKRIMLTARHTEYRISLRVADRYHQEPVYVPRRCGSASAIMETFESSSHSSHII